MIRLTGGNEMSIGIEAIGKERIDDRWPTRVHP